MDYYFGSRQWARHPRSDLYHGAKAYDRFNAALNYLYFKLKERIQGSLSRAGFSYFYPGAGLIHQRWARHQPRSVQHRSNQEIIYDVMDAYRPAIRHALLCWFQPHLLAMEAESPLTAWIQEKRGKELPFFAGQDERGDRVWYLPAPSRKVLDELFAAVCATPFLYDTGEGVERLPLAVIMDVEARHFARFLADPSHAYLPFNAFPDESMVDPRTPYYALVAQVIAGRPLTTLPVLPPVEWEAVPEEPVTEAEEIMAVREEAPPVLTPLPALTDPSRCRTLLREWGVNPDAIDLLNGTTLDQLAFLRPADLAQAGIPLEEAGWLIARAKRHRADLLRQLGAI